MSSFCAAPTPEVPSLDGSWVLEVTTAGGVMGTGAGIPTVTIASDGRLTCPDPDCRRTINAGDLRRLTSLLGNTSWPTLPFDLSICSDCLRTVVTIHRREAGAIITRQLSWDVTQDVSPSLRELAAAALRLVDTP